MTPVQTILIDRRNVAELEGKAHLIAEQQAIAAAEDGSEDLGSALAVGLCILCAMRSD